MCPPVLSLIPGLSRHTKYIRFYFFFSCYYDTNQINKTPTLSYLHCPRLPWNTYAEPSKTRRSEHVFIGVPSKSIPDFLSTYPGSDVKISQPPRGVSPPPRPQWRSQVRHHRFLINMEVFALSFGSVLCSKCSSLLAYFERFIFGEFGCSRISVPSRNGKN